MQKLISRGCIIVGIICLVCGLIGPALIMIILGILSNPK